MCSGLHSNADACATGDADALGSDYSSDSSDPLAMASAPSSNAGENNSNDGRDNHSASKQE